MTKAIVFNKTGYDPFIDFIKAYAIICVLIGHTLPVTQMGYGLWAGMQVPLFILVQTFHFYKKENTKLNFRKISQRIILPFVLFGIFEFGIFLLFSNSYDYKSLITKWLQNGGGYGPGSYFPIVYIQIALLLPCFRWLSRRFTIKQLLWIFLILVEGLEIICSYIQPPEWLFRILCIRYLFLIYLGWIWVKEGVNLNAKMIVLSIISFLAIVYFEYITDYYSINNEPCFFSAKGWTFHRWPCYYYVANGLVYIVYSVWLYLKKSIWIEKVIKELAKSSYEIFLVQMLACLFLDGYLPFELPQVVTILLIWIVSIFGGIVVNILLNRVFTKKFLCIKT